MKKYVILFIILLLFKGGFSQNTFSINELDVKSIPAFNFKKNFYLNLYLSYAKIKGTYNDEGKLQKYEESRDYLLAPIQFEMKILDNVTFMVNTSVNLDMSGDYENDFINSIELDETWLSMRYLKFDQSNSQAIQLVYKINDENHKYLGGYGLSYNYNSIKTRLLYSVNLGYKILKCNLPGGKEETVKMTHGYILAGEVNKNGLCISPILGGFYTISGNVMNSSSRIYLGVKILKFSEGRFLNKITVTYDIKGKNHPGGFGVEINLF